MIRSFTKNHKVLTACTATVAAGSLLLLKQENRYIFYDSFLMSSLKMSDAMERVSRTTYFLGNAAYIVFDYWNSFRNVERDTPEYKTLEHEINERTAKRVFQICELFLYCLLIVVISEAISPSLARCYPRWRGVFLLNS